ncbi:MAG: hypothetical protein JKY65_25300, partial [Planctomycetes bacterium]|nr:hypothetical protein [Planctomycetota bacterium]
GNTGSLIDIGHYKHAGPGGAGAPAAAGGMGASRAYSGKAFEKATEFEDAAIHEKLAAIWTKPEGQGGGQGGGEDPQAGGGGQAGGAQPTAQGEGEEEGYDWKLALVTKSRIYLLRVEAEMSSDVKNTFRVVLTRGKDDKARALLIEEVAQ